MKIVFFNRSLMSGGIEKCIELLSSYLYQNHELEIIYLNDDKLDDNIVNILSKYAKVSKLDNKIIECDLCIFCYLYFDVEKVIAQIHAKEYFCWIHSRPRELENCVLDNQCFIERVSQFVCVSDEIKDKLQISKQGIVIHNFVDKNIKQLADEPIDIQRNEDALKLVIVSRLSKGKGFNRVERLIKALENKKVSYQLQIIGKGRAEEQKIRQSLDIYDCVEFLGYQENPYKYVKRADYLVLLSDYETWGNVITEAKVLHVPCIVTNFPSVHEQIEDGKNGIIVPLELKDYDSIVENAMVRKEELKQRLRNFTYENEIDKWNELILRVKNKEKLDDLYEER